MAEASGTLQEQLNEAVNAMEVTLSQHGSRVAAMELATAKIKATADADRRQLKELADKVAQAPVPAVPEKPARGMDDDGPTYPVYPSRWGDPETLLELWQNGSALMGWSRFLQANTVETDKAAGSLYLLMPNAAKEQLLKKLSWKQAIAYNETNTEPQERPADTFMAVEFPEEGLRYMDMPGEITLDWDMNGAPAGMLSLVRLEAGEAIPDIRPEGSDWIQTVDETTDPAGLLPGRYAVICAMA